MSKKKIPEIKLIGWVKNVDQRDYSSSINNLTSIHWWQSLSEILTDKFSLRFLDKTGRIKLKDAGFEKFDKVEITIRKVS